MRGHNTSRTIQGHTPWSARGDSQYNGGMATRKHRATDKPNPSDLFDWPRAIEGFRRIMNEVYDGGS